jgi:hypothetical protein
MNRVVNKNKRTVTPEHVMVWAMRKAKMPIAQCAKVLEIGETTVKRYFTDMENFVGQEFDEKLLKRNLLGLYPKAIMALERLIDGDNPATVIAFFKGMGIWTEKSEHDHSGLGATDSDSLKRKLVGLGIPVTGATETGDGDSQRTNIPS